MTKKLFKYSFSLSFCIVFVSCCLNQTNGKTTPTEVPDKVFLADESYSDLFTDSVSLETFIQQNKGYIKFEKEIIKFYKKRNYSYAWFSEDGISEQAQHFVNMFNNYSTTLRDNTLKNDWLDSLVHVFRDEGFSLKEDHELIEKTELTLTAHFFVFSQNAYEGKQKNLQGLSWYIPRRKLDLEALLESMTDKSKDSMVFREPVSEQYKALKQQLLRVYELEKSDTIPTIVIKQKKLVLGDSLKAIAQIRSKLHLWGELNENSRSAKFDTELENAIKSFQLKRGLQADGVVGQQTLNAINLSMCQVTQQIMVNLERMRWIPFEQNGDFFVVNIPEFMLHIFEDGKYLKSTEVIVGKAVTNTVIFNDIFEFVVFAPYWNVPASIQRNEIEPAIRKNPNYLSAKNMERLPNGTIRQKPGPGNALGQVKFLFPNSYNIYLHDTPTKNLFNESKRLFSHGCIRVNNPKDIAVFLLKNQPEWTEEKVEEAMNWQAEKFIKITRPVQIFITYFTAWVDKEGNLQLREDVYGHDKKLANLMFSECFW